jgi:Tfp pilus assembly protein PilN
MPFATIVPRFVLEIDPTGWVLQFDEERAVVPGRTLTTYVPFDGDTLRLVVDVNLRNGRQFEVNAAWLERLEGSRGFCYHLTVDPTDVILLAGGLPVS